MNKSLYIFICLLLSINFWDLRLMPDILNSNVYMVLTWLWALMAFILFPNRTQIKGFYTLKNIKYMYFIFLGILISMFSAWYFWEQDFITTLIAQRGIYSFILFPAMLYAQPKEKDIFESLKWISYGTILVWIVSIFDPYEISNLSDEIVYRENGNSTKIGFYVSGFRFVILYFYYILFRLLKKYSLEQLIAAIFFLIFFLLFQNRSILIGAIAATLYFIWKFNSKYKILIFLIAGILIAGIIIQTINIWTTLWDQSVEQFGDKDYNRWKAFYYFLFDYSPNWFCYLFGNGFPSGGNSPLGNLMWLNFKNGIYASDLGMIGMWTSYGLIPIFVIYSLTFNILRKKIYPLYLKFFAMHICLAPIIFHFWAGEGVMLMVLIVYLYIYQTQFQNIRNAINYYRQFQKRRKNNIICEGGIN